MSPTTQGPPQRLLVLDDPELSRPHHRRVDAAADLEAAVRQFARDVLERDEWASVGGSSDEAVEAELVWVTVDGEPWEAAA